MVSQCAAIAGTTNTHRWFVKSWAVATPSALRHMEEVSQMFTTSAAMALSPTWASVRRSGTSVMVDWCLSTVQVNMCDNWYCSDSSDKDQQRFE